MVKRAGKASDEYPVMAQDLNQSFLGLHFGYNGADATLEKRSTVIEDRFPVAT